MFNKYKNQKVKTLNNGTFDSKLEYKHFCDLSLLLKARKIEKLTRQVRIPLGRGKIKYVADFCYFDKALKMWVVWDSKGIETKEFKIKLAWLLESFSNFSFYLAKSRDFKVFEPVGCGADFSAFMDNYFIKKGGKQ